MALTEWADAGVRTVPPHAETSGVRGPQLLSVSAAARLLGVSSSSLRAWAAAGRVPHVRTPGGHRRFELDELIRWLAERGGAPPSPSTRTGDLVPTRIEPMPALADALRARSEAVVTAFEEELAQARAPGASRAAAGRRSRVLGTLESLADALEAGDLGECYEEAEWEGFRDGASGQPGDAVVTEALSVRRAVDRVLTPASERRPLDRRALERALDRIAVRVASGYADGVRCRLRSAVE
jgi:excisionase family DNA binding protein